MSEENTQSRAEYEIQLANEDLKTRFPNYQDKDSIDYIEYNYTKSCHDAALQLYNFFEKQGHSGLSWKITLQLFNKLANDLPLKPITENDEFVPAGRPGTFQCVRMSSLFKDVNPDGTVSYRDIDRAFFIDLHENVSSTYPKILDKLEPITLPYMPPAPYKKYFVYGETFYSLDYNATGVYDRKAYLYYVKPNGERIDINKFYKETSAGFVEITKEEYETDKMNAKNESYKK